MRTLLLKVGLVVFSVLAVVAFSARAQAGTGGQANVLLFNTQNVRAWPTWNQDHGWGVCLQNPHGLTKCLYHYNVAGQGVYRWPQVSTGLYYVKVDYGELWQDTGIRFLVWGSTYGTDHGGYTICAQETYVEEKRWPGWICLGPNDRIPNGYISPGAF